ncbi:predicted protein [Nematostella vectensis]|uniref:G-protein coupled receptors family 1 profile domain-containing protein n=1 Tax=Nematostella vectensis TaxID=45351 RepID=A7SLS4_NEMVE|nr:predicted protein [Nematostella vectensis]|eukprot:XP_001627463.1 predicted protein [Nematostella vectensis]
MSSPPSTFNHSLISNGTNTSSSERSSASIHQEVRLVSLLLVVIIGLSLNLSVISLVIMKQVPRRNMNLLVANMALSDFLSLLLEPSYLLSNMTMGNLPWIEVSYLADVTCKFYAFMIDTSTWVSNVTLLVISVERFRAVSSVAHVPEKRSVFIILLLMSWVLPGLLNSSAFVFCWATKIRGTFQCLRVTTMQSELYAVATNAIFILLVVVILCLNFSIILKLVRSQEAIHIPEAQQQKRARRFRSATRMVLSSLLLFVLCATPLYTVLTIFRMEFLLGVPILGEWGVNMINALHVLFFVNPAASPIIYFVFLGDFKKVLHKFCCRKMVIGQTNAQPGLPLA